MPSSGGTAAVDGGGAQDILAPAGQELGFELAGGKNGRKPEKKNKKHERLFFQKNLHKLIVKGIISKKTLCVKKKIVACSDCGEDQTRVKSIKNDAFVKKSCKI